MKPNAFSLWKGCVFEEEILTFHLENKPFYFELREKSRQSSNKNFRLGLKRIEFFTSHLVEEKFYSSKFIEK